jgi:hypothetical protein
MIAPIATDMPALLVWELPGDVWIDPLQAADALGVTTKLLSQWRCARKGPPYAKLGKAVRYRVGTLREYLSALETELCR